MSATGAWVVGCSLLVIAWGVAAQSAVPRQAQATFQVRIAYSKGGGTQAASCAVFASPSSLQAATGTPPPTRLSCLSSVLASLHAPGAGADGRTFMGSITLDDAALAALDPGGPGMVDEAVGRQSREIEVKF